MVAERETKERLLTENEDRGGELAVEGKEIRKTERAERKRSNEKAVLEFLLSSAEAALDFMSRRACKNKRTPSN